jgi:hypothetical protein
MTFWVIHYKRVTIWTYWETKTQNFTYSTVDFKNKYKLTFLKIHMKSHFKETYDCWTFIIFALCCTVETSQLYKVFLKYFVIVGGWIGYSNYDTKTCTVISLNAVH